ncbi:LabA-like protein [Brevundimonas sp. Leaf363]|uniref:LabA-like NYN domain-containing protein n=1 Tax=Brevundimonas sp. Leaf363 TaxID=1736353 RepID=UPI0006F7E5D8|nr:NYN domain-containing protein [Brevundimonas sp. Leaf363]KQS56181.1 LabA-like protein [Brevundimonas sp. Leaf363]
MRFHPNDRLAVFIDGANLHSTTRALQTDLDFKRMLEWFAEQSQLVRVYYYTAVVEGEEFSPVNPLVDWLGYNGFTVVTKPVKRFTDAQGHSRMKGNMDVEIAVDVMALAPKLDHVVLASGDGDFRRLVEVVQAMGVKVTVLSSQKTQPPHAADDLRRQADDFIELFDLLPVFGRARTPRDA